MANEDPSQKSSVTWKTSKYIGVSKPKGKDGAYLASVHDREKGKAVHLGTFNNEEEAARARDIAAFKFAEKQPRYNFQLSDYEKVLKLMENMTCQEVVTTIKRCSDRFVRVSESDYRGVSRAPTEGKWKACKRVRNVTTYLGTYGTPEEAAMAFDVEEIKLNGWKAVTNFDIKLYNVEGILGEPGNASFAKNRANLVSKKLLDMPQKYANGKGKLFLEKIEDLMRTEITGPGETSNSFQDLAKLPPYHFPAGAGSKFRHSSSSCFKPYKRPENM